jgi:hypothetical protein
MVDLNKLSRPALAAAMKGGTAAWGQMGSASTNVRYSEALPKRRGRRRDCHCGCEKRVTHACMASGVALGQSCELGAARWVRTGSSKPASKIEAVGAKEQTK